MSSHNARLSKTYFTYRSAQNTLFYFALYYVTEYTIFSTFYTEFTQLTWFIWPTITVKTLKRPKSNYRFAPTLNRTTPYCKVFHFTITAVFCIALPDLNPVPQHGRLSFNSSSQAIRFYAKHWPWHSPKPTI
jgi:hypothetical protein